MDVEALRRKVAAHSFWYHRIELPGGVVTPGASPLDADAYGVPPDLSGKRVLDVGAWDGYWSFEALRRGAKEVVAIDDFSDYLGKLAPEQRQAWATFDLCREALGYDEQLCDRIEMSVYDVNPEMLGTFDVVFFFGTLYHLRHPLLGLDALSSVCSGELYVETTILDDYSAYGSAFGGRYSGDHVVMEFYPTNEYAGNPTNWWNPTLNCLTRMVYAAGFVHQLKGWKLVDKATQIGLCRGFASGSKIPVDGARAVAQSAA